MVLLASVVAALVLPVTLVVLLASDVTVILNGLGAVNDFAIGDAVDITNGHDAFPGSVLFAQAPGLLIVNATSVAAPPNLVLATSWVAQLVPGPPRCTLPSSSSVTDPLESSSATWSSSSFDFSSSPSPSSSSSSATAAALSSSSSLATAATSSFSSSSSSSLSPPDYANVSTTTVVATPTKLVADGVYYITIVVTTLDSDYHRVAGQNVTLMSRRGALDSIRPAYALSDANGEVNFTATSVVMGLSAFYAGISI